jgi:DNA repair ATPase RecN
MATAHQEYESILEQGKRTSRFFRVALHVHSAASHDFGSRTCDKNINDKERLVTDGGRQEFVIALQEKLDLVAITDHMICSEGVALSRLPAPRTNFMVLPGMEVNVRLKPPLDSYRFHLLAIYPPGTSIDQINRMFFNHPEVSAEDRRDQKNCEVCNVDLVEFIKDIRKTEGLCLLAHLGSTNSLRFTWHQVAKDILGPSDPTGRIPATQLYKVSEDFKTLLASLDIDGVEVAKPDDRKHYSWIQDREGRLHNIPVLLPLDAHSIEDLARTDKHCYVKMTDVSFDGLRAALKMPHTRIRFKNDLPTPPSPALIGLTLSSSGGEGFFQSAILPLSENLNCIIGPRGSGKSTLIDALRYVFGYNKTLNELEDDPGLIRAIKGRQEQNLRDTIIRVYYRRRDGAVHVLEATYDKKSQYVTKVYTLEGHPVGVDDLEKSGDYPLRLFGWSEIETIGRSPTHQRELVDRLIPSLSELTNNRSKLRNAVKSNADDLLKISSNLKLQFDKNNQIIVHFTEYSDDFARLNTPEIQAKFTALDSARRRQRALDFVVQTFDDHLSKLRDLEPSLLTGLIEQGIQNVGDDIAQWWRAEIKSQLGYDTQIGLAAGTHAQSISTLTSLREQAYALREKLIKDGDEVEKNIRQLLAENTQAQVAANLRTQAEERLSLARKSRDDYLAIYSKFEEKRKERQELLGLLARKQLEISGLRNTQRETLTSKLNNFRTERFRIGVEFKSGGDRTDLLGHLSSKEFLSKLGVQHRNRKWPELLSLKFNPCELAEKIWMKQPNALVIAADLDGQKRSISAEEATDLVTKRNPIGHHDGASVPTVDKNLLQILLELEGIPWDDLVQITLNDEPVEKKSPGQRSSAMLPLIALSEESTPLVIDQPEDNLDNRLVGEVVAGILASLKERRQVIAATHNPNIVVSGDAEQIIVLDAIGDNRGKVEDCGSIDLPSMSSGDGGHVIKLLEGGKEAFCVRKDRYDL